MRSPPRVAAACASAVTRVNIESDVRERQGEQRGAAHPTRAAESKASPISCGGNAPGSASARGSAMINSGGRGLAAARNEAGCAGIRSLALARSCARDARDLERERATSRREDAHRDQHERRDDGEQHQRLDLPRELDASPWSRHRVWIW